MFLVDEVLLRSHDRKVVLHRARVVLRVEINLDFSESESVKYLGEVEKYRFWMEVLPVKQK